MSKETSIRSRQSGIELLKIIAMLMIVIFHCEMSFISKGSPFLVCFDISQPTTDITIFLTQIIYYIGMIGNALFLLSSVWFLIDSNNMKLSKIACMILNVYVVSVIFLLIFLGGGYHLTVGDMKSSLSPTLFGSYWYTTCYLLLYAIFPLLNSIIEKITQKQHLAYNCAFFVLYFCIQSINIGVLFVNRLILFVGIYFIAAYLKKYNFKLISNPKINAAFLIIGIALLILLQLCMNFLGLHIDTLADKIFYFRTNHNPIILIISISMFNIFRNIKMQSRLVNYISSLTIFIYIFHENILFKKYLRPKLMFDFWEATGKINIALFALLCGLVLFIAATAAAVVYSRLLQPVVGKVADILLEECLKLYGKFESFMLKIK